MNAFFISSPNHPKSCTCSLLAHPPVKTASDIGELSYTVLRFIQQKQGKTDPLLQKIRHTGTQGFSEAGLVPAWHAVPIPAAAAPANTTFLSIASLESKQTKTLFTEDYP